MKKLLFFASLLLLSANTMAANLANGEKINKSCALCHGAFGQGAPGKLSPRIAGMPKEYIIKAVNDYIDGTHRKYGLMVFTSQLDTATENDIDDIATYLAGLDLSSDTRFNVDSTMGDAKAGKKVYRDCRNCHAKDGYGKPNKEAPPLAGQHGSYLYTTMKGFQSRLRIHDNDPEDDSFDDYTDEELANVIAYLATLDDKKVVEGYEFTLPVIRMAAKASASDLDGLLEITDIKQTVVKMAIKDGVTREEVIEAMNSKAVEINLKMVGEQYVSNELEQRGVDSPYLSIHQYCNPMDARLMIIANPIYSSYMPCRISMVEDQKGKTWLMMLNLDMLINSKLLPGNVTETAMKVNQQMLDIMVAGSKGEF